MSRTIRRRSVGLSDELVYEFRRTSSGGEPLAAEWRVVLTVETRREGTWRPATEAWLREEPAHVAVLAALEAEQRLSDLRLAAGLTDEAPWWIVADRLNDSRLDPEPVPVPGND